MPEQKTPEQKTPEQGAAEPAMLASLTTAGVGGPAANFVVAASEAEIIDAVRSADAAGEPLLIIGGGSNLVVADAGYPGTVLRIASRGFELDDADATLGGVFLRVQAGQPWDELVRTTVLHAWSGLEALSGIPGLTGATPVQNVGAYGAEVSRTLASVRTWDRATNAVKTFANSDLRFGYRDSLLKQTTVNGSPRYVVLTVDFQLPLGRESAPVRYAELARALGVEVGQRAYANDVRREVLRLRAAKGMVLDPADRDTFSTGSFFTNPIVSAAVADALPPEAPRYPVPAGAADTRRPADAGTAAGAAAGGDAAGPTARVKLSAAWLIDRAGFPKGFGLPGSRSVPAGPQASEEPIDGLSVAGGRASLSTKHTLAITNRGGASAEDMLAIARTVRDGVEARFGIRLEPEPLLIGCAL